MSCETGTVLDRRVSVTEEKPPAASAGEAAAYSSGALGGCEVRLRFGGGSAARIASGCSGAFAGASCAMCKHTSASTAHPHKATENWYPVSFDENVHVLMGRELGRPDHSRHGVSALTHCHRPLLGPQMVTLAEQQDWALHIALAIYLLVCYPLLHSFEPHQKVASSKATASLKRHFQRCCSILEVTSEQMYKHQRCKATNHMRRCLGPSEEGPLPSRI